MSTFCTHCQAPLNQCNCDLSEKLDALQQDDISKLKAEHDKLKRFYDEVAEIIEEWQDDGFIDNVTALDLVIEVWRKHTQVRTRTVDKS